MSHNKESENFWKFNFLDVDTGKIPITNLPNQHNITSKQQNWKGGDRIKPRVRFMWLPSQDKHPAERWNLNFGSKPQTVLLSFFGLKSMQ